ncbi:GroL Chaperonin GroEL (HSP60 family) [uncultured Caudovirales phage]|uniref:GroL Chaperonin GroEL (HSP60 family) n=1 Tax=uncultured Caudovirales phage TaxID=2100421 RepID=A0A6J5Q070_9CAUD|nr:GroL Chaperonin GroEL (HSP60 family) [uncultured Caudovirales phage]CAB4176177.1 GroL Chaperonin GroEL (HSP60 family) [uncultured Caudovirales phage]CAB4180867.1 GroL Chaperonin GroEL (HSP60 family) [uncultured Caudovirales phage]CAB4198313.1 GroL Chaperonin GroEL (HSP60 family) [uncultured Caudovirales phage]CAB4210433.1 GroL Chaperonin GroEL (HSP60 family) [uncultured Caudovirales phage]
MSIKTVEIYHGDAARKPMLAGINEFAEAVGSTLGSQGKNVIIEKGVDGVHQITKDGVTVAKSIYFKDPLKNLGAQLVKTVTEKTANFIGDGTTSSTVLAAAMCNEGYEYIQQDINTVDLKKGLDYAKSKFITLLESYVDIIPDDNDGEMAYKIATISSNYDEDIAVTLRDTFKKVGKNGVIVVDKEIQSSEKTKTMHLDLIEGFRVENGYIHNQFILGNSNNRWEANDCKILVLPMDITNFAPIHSIVEQCASKGEPILIIANDFTGDSVRTMVENNARGSVKICGIKSPSVGEEKAQILEDICIYTGAKYHKTSDGRFRDAIVREFLGTAEKVIVERTHTTILSGKGDPIMIQNRVDSITTDIDSGTLTAYQRTYYLARKAQLLGQVAMIKVCGQTDTDLSEKLDRVDDAVHATKSAITYGCVPGGGSTLFKISHFMQNLLSDNNTNGFNAGILVFIRALRAPISKIISNATGLEDVTEYLDKINKSNHKESGIFGFDANTSSIVNMLDTNIIDPYEVVKYSVLDAAAVVGIWLTTDTAVINVRKDATENLRDLLLGNVV